MRSAVHLQSSANFFAEHLFTVNCIEKTKIKKKRLGIVHFLNNEKTTNSSLDASERISALHKIKGIHFSHITTITFRGRTNYACFTCSVTRFVRKFASVVKY